MNQRYQRIKTEDITDKLKTNIWKVEANDLQELPQRDMPGNTVRISEGIVCNTNKLVGEVIRQIKPVILENSYQRVVVSVSGGSGVGKTSIAYLLSWYFNQIGVGSYTLSGDNYPHRIPKYNDAERFRIFSESGIRRMIESEVYTEEYAQLIRQWQDMGEDADPLHLKEHPWFQAYLDGGRMGLEGYLGTEREQDFKAVSEIVAAFKDGAEKIWLKRMGREETELWYEQVDFSKIHILIVEWTHGNSEYLQGVDIPVLLNSTPEETLKYRKARKRDAGIDSPFTAMVLEIEQEKIQKQAFRAKIILSRSGELIGYEEYCKLMKESELR